jgi:methylenetetrahydrofolate reductase (NADPH)
MRPSPRRRAGQSQGKGRIAQGNVDAVNVTDNQTAMVRMSSFAACVLLKQMGLHPVMQMVTRDRNRLAMQATSSAPMPTASTPCCACPAIIPKFGDHPMAANVTIWIRSS